MKLLIILLFLQLVQVRIHSFLEKTKMYQRKKIVAPTEESFRKDVEIRRKRVKSLIRRRKILEVQKLVKDEEIKPCGRDTQAKVCDQQYLFLLK